MPIQVSPVSALNLFQIKNAIDKLSRDSFSLANPGGGEGELFVDTVPTTDTLESGQAIFYYDGANYRIYFNINNVIKFVALT